MNRYQNIQTFPPTSTLPRRYVNVKYPEISKDFSDIYVFTTQGDRYDLLADTYYRNSSLWWIISIANQDSSYDSLIPPIGAQIRIPNFSRIGQIQTEFENLNNLDTTTGGGSGYII